MKTISEDIKTGRIRPVYLLYGEETYLLRQYRGRLRDALADADDTVNTTYFEGRDTDPAKVIDLAETMPFFADHRSIFLDDTGWFKKGGEEIAAYLPEMPETTHLIFSEAEVDRRTALFKQVKKAGHAAEFPRQTEETLTRWVLGRMKREGKQITRPVMEAFLSATGNDMALIDNEMEKLFSYTMGRNVIELADVEAICGTQVNNRIFDMIDAIADRQQKRALELYYDLILLKEPPMRILVLLTRQFRILLMIKEMAAQGFDRRSMAARAKVPEFAVRKYVSQAAKFTEEKLHDAVRDGVQAEEDIKTGKMGDRLAVELLLVTYSR